ncbi:MAG TPA: Crp/Fnr family transcriptional regulator [Rhodocyclaceae bacterium]|nr:MAG: Crp/Fnr family transcriptional regulator [Rhodocyclales bacterium CG17_big_fil_post_rev_8_21_14_2_50_68_7]PIX74713.1 MAG: Crp/Fnr family transcriptional regulator [Rhodocyclales bacterium CG_4_10_14_3_um_filter_68_10]PJA58460.1 MAG: Crp/Fnr family transcriptional regulator [Rhodocyclales bacterium CG_4_9_14_3_um_filter_68_10]HCX32526.1 Crp/Fnr family transcriptional regulator [Rhodocyclaceae bacterium]
MRTLDAMLETSPWFVALGAPARERVRTSLVVREYPTTAFVCRKGEPSDHWIGVIEGLVKLNALSPSGKCVTFTGVPAGSWFGEGSVLKREARKYDVIALRASRVVLMPEATFHWLLDTSFSFNRHLLMQLNERVGQFIGMVEHERLLEPDAKVARALASLFNPQLYPATGPQIQISQEELGYLAGVSRQRVNQALQQLEKAGLVKAEYSAVTILDLDGLRCFEG